MAASAGWNEVAMLSHLRRRAEEAIAHAHRVVLSTCGPADIQTGEFECEARGLRLYLLLPLASDHLFNLEEHAKVVVLGKGWSLHGSARLIEPAAAPADLILTRTCSRHWMGLIEVRATRLHIGTSRGSPDETIDIEDTGDA